MVRVRPRRRDASRCGVCGRRAPGYDRGEGRRRWRALDLGATKAFVEAAAPRVECRRARRRGRARAAWARHGCRFTRAFEEQVAWLATHCSKSAVCELMRICWPTVGRIIERVVAERAARRGDPLEGLRRIGIDELSYRKGQRYITVVVDHDSGRLVWAAEGRDKQTVARLLRRSSAPSAAAQLELVSSDLGEWITRAVARALPRRDALPRPLPRRRARQRRARRGAPRGLEQARRAGDASGARWLKGARWALWKRPERLTERQQAKLADDRARQPPPLPRLPPEGAAAARLPQRARRGRASRCSTPGSAGRAAAGSRASSSSKHSRSRACQSYSDGVLDLGQRAESRVHPLGVRAELRQQRR